MGLYLYGKGHVKLMGWGEGSWYEWHCIRLDVGKG